MKLYRGDSRSALLAEGQLNDNLRTYGYGYIEGARRLGEETSMSNPTYVNYTDDLDDHGHMAKDAFIQRMSAYEDAIDHVNRCAADCGYHPDKLVGLSVGGDCWLKYPRQKWKSCELQIDQIVANVNDMFLSGFAVARSDLIISLPGSHPGGDCIWIWPLFEVMGPQLQEDRR